MKTLVKALAAMLITMMFSPMARADRDSERIYFSLYTFGRIVDSFGPETTEKSVGGLVCKQFKMMAGATAYLDFECEMSKKNRDDKAIYQALSTTAVRDLRAPAGETVDVKEIGNLKCTHAASAAGGKSEKFNCVLD